MSLELVKDNAVIDKKMLERSIVEMCLPSHMLLLMSYSVVAAGYELRRDMKHRLNAGAAAPLHVIRTDAEAVRRVAARVDELSQRLLNVLSPDDSVHGMYATAMFTLRLVEERMLSDPKNMGVLVAMLLIDDLKQEGGMERYTFKEAVLLHEADKMLMAARREGVYLVQLTALATT